MPIPPSVSGADLSRESGDLPPRSALDAARDELRADTLRGTGGRATLERYSARVDAIIRQLYADSGLGRTSAAVLALGGYGRRHLCLYSDIDVLILFRDAIGADEEKSLRAFLHPLWDLGVVVGHQVRELSDFDTLETDNPEFLLALVDARPVAGGRDLFDHFTHRLPHRLDARIHPAVAARRCIDQRHAQFNGTLYQLEPDVKDSPGRTPGSVCDADDRAADRSAAAASRSGGSGAVRRRRGLPAARAFDAASRRGASAERPQPRAAGTHRRPARLSRRRTADACRAADERLLPARPDRQPFARVGAQDGAGAGGDESRSVARRHPLSRSGAGGEKSRELGGRLRSRARQPRPR